MKQLKRLINFINVRLTGNIPFPKEYKYPEPEIDYKNILSMQIQKGKQQLKYG